MEDFILPSDHIKFEIELRNLGWLTEIHDGKKINHVVTSEGIDFFYSFYKILDSQRLFGVNSPNFPKNHTSNTRFMLEHGIITRYFDTDLNSEKITSTPYGFELFKSFSFWLDRKQQKREAQKKIIRDVTQKMLKEVVKFCKESGKMSKS